MREKIQKYFTTRQFEGSTRANPPRQARIMPKRNKYIQSRAQNLQGDDRPQKKAKTTKENEKSITAFYTKKALMVVKRHGQRENITATG